MKKIIVIVLILIGIMMLSLAVYAEDSVELESQDDSVSGEALKELGLIEGNGNGLNEEGDITREAIVKMLVSLTTDLSVEFELPETPTFSDVTKEHWAYSWVERAYAADLTKGIGGGLFGLGQNVTKQQVSAFMLNALNEEYTYALAEGKAYLKGISTEVVENFNRGNSFEMVAKTLLQVPAGQEKALYELTMNFEGKNFRKVVAGIELRRDEAKKAAEAKAAEAARLAEAARKAEASDTITKYRSMWPNSKVTLIEWLYDIEELLDPDWVETSQFISNLYGRNSYEFTKETPEASYISVKLNNDHTVTIEHYVVKNSSYVVVDSYFLENVKLWKNDQFSSMKITGEYNKNKYTAIILPDSNTEDHKGILKISDVTYITRPGRQEDVMNSHIVTADLSPRHRNEGFASLKFSEFQSIISEDLTMSIVCEETVIIDGIYNSYRVGMDEYVFKLNSLKWKNDAAYLTIEKSYDNEVVELPLSSIRQNSKGDLITFEYQTSDGSYAFLVIKLNDDNKVVMAYLYHGIDYTGSYILDK